MSRPGVYVSEAPLSRIVSSAVATQSYGAFIGTALRGPTVPTRIDSWTDFIALFGGIAYNKTLPLALYQFFSNSKSAAYVCRVLASDAVAASKIFNDGSARMTITAETKGVWGNSIYYSIEDLSVSLQTFSFTVYDTVRGSRVVVERFKDLTMSMSSGRYFANVINSNTIGSNYVTVTDTLKNNAPLIKGTTAGTPEQLTSGTDGVAAITSADYDSAFTKFDNIDALLVVNAPGQPVVTNIVAKAEARGDSIVVVDTVENQTSDMVGFTVPVSSYASVYYPWIYIADPAPDAPRGSIVKVPPGASAVGVILNSETRGVHKAPAGTSARVAGAVNVETLLSNTILDTLADTHVNVIRPLSGIGINVMGARTGSSDIAQYLSIRRTLNYIKKRAAATSQFALFEPNTPGLWDQIRVANGSFLGELWQSGALAGGRPDKAYYVICDESNNTPQTIANGEVHVEIGVAPVFPAEFIIIRVGAFATSTSTTITEEGLF